MTPIERISAKNDALATLGLKDQPTKTELREVYRKLAFEFHPDQGTGTSEHFSQISQAYAYLCKIIPDEPQLVEPKKPRTVSRPTLRVTETEFSKATLNECRSVFEDAPRANARHLAIRLIRKGRTLTYIVPDKAMMGLNQVSVPTGDLTGRIGAAPKMLEIWSGDLEGQTYNVPAQQCAKLFAGARAVQIRFGEMTRH